LTTYRAKPLFVGLLLLTSFAVLFSSVQIPVTSISRTISLSPPIGPTGTNVALSGTGFDASDTSCTISGSNPSLIFSQTAGTISSGTVTGYSFIVGPVSTGTYTVTLTCNPQGDSASATFTVTAASVPTIVVNPADGPLGTKVTLGGTGFSTKDNICQITSNITNLLLSPSCSVSGGKVTGSFTVGSIVTVITPASVKVIGSTNDNASTVFFIDPQPVLTFTINGSPTTSGSPGSTVIVGLKSDTQFSSGDTSCSISSTPGGLFQSSSCHIGGNGADLTGTFFVVASVANGSSYQVQVKGNLGDIGTGVFTVFVHPQVTFTPSIGQPTQTITFFATGLLLTDTSCSLNATAVSSSAGNLLSSRSCSISSGTATGSFVVALTATADGSPYTVTIIGNPGNDRVSGFFTVIPIIFLSPNNGPSGAFVSITGFGFSSKASACAGSVSPIYLTSFIACQLSQVTAAAGSVGQVTGSFTVGGYAAAPAGIYVVTITDLLHNNASAFFTVGGPTAQVTISPNVGIATPPGPTSAGVTGFGFSVNDNSCTITAGGSLIAFSTCNISGGTVGGSFTISGSAAPGIYLITVNAFLPGSPPVANDFASNYFEVASATATTITTTSFTSSTSTTSFSTSITTTNTFSTLTTTTFTFTGVSTWTSWFFTSTTTTGQSTSTQTITTTATSSMIPITATQTSTTTVISTHTFGMAATPSFSSHASISEQAFGLLALLALIVPMMLRRLLV
jgi:hypothetical protein